MIIKTKSRNILIVDDRENSLILLESLLKESGYNVVSTINGKDALEKLRSDKEYDLIISDILMPEMDGFMLCKSVKTDEKLKDIPFIFLSASYVDEKDEMFALKLGAEKFLRKPFKPVEFLKIVQDLLDDTDGGGKKPQEMVLECDKDVFRLYNERLVEKLEDKAIALGEEIIERKRVEEALRESEYRFRRYFDLGLVGMAITSLEKDWVEFNDTLCNMFGYLREEFAKLTWTELTHPDDLESDLAQFNRVLVGEIDGYSIEKRFIRRDGSVLYVMSSTNALLKADGSVDYFVALVHDITERKKMEDALLKSEKLKSIGTATAGISHDFNNMLAIISGNVELLQRTYKDHGKLLEALHTIERAVDDGAEICSKMLKFTRTENDHEDLSFCDVSNLIRQSIDFIMPILKSEALTRDVNYKIDTEGMKSVISILCNPTELREVFVNIINNALDAMPEGGMLTIKTRPVRSEKFEVEVREKNASALPAHSSREQVSGLKLNDAFVEITFTDTGDGMTEDVKKNIFDPFFTTKRVAGTGLGMSMAYGIITRHGGKINVDSEVGKGSTFTLQFPTKSKADLADSD